MKKILHIAKYYYPFRGGTEQIAQDCVSAFKEDCEQKVICFNHETGDAKDTVDGIEKGRTLLAEKGKAGDVCNISSEYVYKMTDIVELIEKQSNHKLEIKVDEKLIRPTDEKIIVGDITKFQKDTGWKQDIKMEQTIANMLEYWREVLP